MIEFPETGYTPANLQHLLRETGWTRKRAAAAIGVEDRRFANWCLPMESKGHRDMPSELWVALVYEAEEDMNVG